MRRVVITGMGVVAAPGKTLPDFFEGLLAGRGGARTIAGLPPDQLERLSCKIGAEVPGFDPLAWFTEKEVDQLDRFAQLGIVAANQALEQAGLTEIPEDKQGRVGIYIGTAYGGIQTLDDRYQALYGRGASRLSPLTIPRVMYNSTASQISMRIGARGPVLAHSTACASASHAVCEAFRCIQRGDADWMLAGGSDAPLTYGVIRGWEAVRVLAPAGDDPARACRPFSADRKGLIIGEGAAVLVLEEYETARTRGAELLAELAGYGATSDASHITQPSVEGPSRAMRLAIEDAGLGTGDIDYINAHGTATRSNDAVETRAIKQVFGERAGSVPVTSTKALHGHVMGASGAIELVATVEALRRGVVPPTAHYTEPDPECDLDYVPNQPREQKLRYALSNSFAFGGLNAVLLVGKT